MGNRFTERAEIALNKSITIAEELGHTYVGTEHILISISEDETSCATVLLTKNGVTCSMLKNSVKDMCGTGKRTKLTSKDTTPRCRRVIENSYKASKKYSSGTIGTEHILLAILEEKESVAYKILVKSISDISALHDDVMVFLRAMEKNCSKNLRTTPTLTYLSKYAKNMTLAAAESKYDPLIGRDQETSRVIKILSRKTKNNPCLIGEAGVGKTAIVEGLAAKIVSGNVPDFLVGKSVYSLNLTSMIAGAKYRGDFEERIKSTMDEVRDNPNIILFIDEIHTIVGAGSAEGAIDAANIIKPELARGDIQIIGATTLNEYKRYIEKDSALERRFQPVIVNEPTKFDTINILFGLKESYENHHNVVIEDEAIKDAVALSERYISDRYFPDKAIDVLDEACASEALCASKKEFEIIQDNIKQIVYPEAYQMNFERNTNQNTKDIINALNSLTAHNYPRVTTHSIIKTVEDMTGIRIENKKIINHLNISQRLKEKIIGQDEAIDSLTESIYKSYADILDPCKPRGIFLFFGESGIGKTELAKEMARVLFGEEESLIRFDMSEYAEGYSVSKLIGSAPGYVGYEDGISGFERIRRRPYSVILLDEIEKAHPDVLNLFLQIFDYGYIKDSIGRKINFRNTYIIMTANIQGYLNSGADIGFVSNNPLSSRNLPKIFKPEFINRIYDVINLKPLSIDSMTKIVKIKFKKIAERLSRKNIHIEIDETVYHYIAEKTQIKKMGARPIDHIISKEIEMPIANIILSEDATTDIHILIATEHDEIQIRLKQPVLKK